MILFYATDFKNPGISQNATMCPAKKFFFRILNRAHAIAALEPRHGQRSAVLKIESDGANRLFTFHGPEIWTNHDQSEFYDPGRLPGRRK